MMRVSQFMLSVAVLKRQTARIALALITILAVAIPFAARAQNANAVICHDIFIGTVKTFEDLDSIYVARHKIYGNKVTSGIIKVDGREDWKVQYESIKGDPKQPLIVLINGFVFARENSSPFVAAVLGAALAGDSRYSVVRYDMSGQGKTIALYGTDSKGLPPWYMSEPLTLDKLRKELVQVVQGVLAKNGLPKNHPIILAGLSFGRALFTPELAPQTVATLEIAGMIRSLDKYNPRMKAAYDAADSIYEATRLLNPFLAPAIKQSTEQNVIKFWRDWYADFYVKNPDNMPSDVVPAWYREASAMRTYAVKDYDANTALLKKVPSFVFVAEVDDQGLKLDQISYFKNSLVKQSPAALIYVRGASHALVQNFSASQIMLNMLKTLETVNLADLGPNGIFEAVMVNGQYEIQPTTIDNLEMEIRNPPKPKQ